MSAPAPALTRGYEVVIGIETHAQLSTRSKIFSGASTTFGAEPNTQASAVDLALPGTLPVANRGAVDRAIAFGLAVGATIAPQSIFARKNYFYPDLPKGYQISQYETPVVQGGSVSFVLDGQPRSVRLTRAHLEEDAGKSLHESYHGEDGLSVQQATVLFNPDTGETRAMRSKEDAHDYRYFPDPDLPPLVIAPEWIAAVRAALPELPAAMAQRLIAQDGLPVDDAAVMTQSLPFARFYEAARDGCGNPKLVANWLMGEFSKRLNAAEKSIAQAPVTPALLARLITRITDGSISHNAARQVFESLWTTVPLADGELADPAQVDALIGSLGLRQMSDSNALVAMIDAVVAQNTRSVDEYRAGKEKAFNALVGQVMKASQGKANPAQVNALLKAKLDSLA